MSIITDWISGKIPTSKEEEDQILLRGSEEYKINCTKNPGGLCEKEVTKVFLKYGYKKVATTLKCDWMGPKKRLQPDLVTDKYVVEVKGMRYYNSQGKRGNQGTAPEKIDSVYRKYSNITDKTVLVVLCADMQTNPDAAMFLDAYTHGYHKNEVVNCLYKTFGKRIIFLRFRDLDDFLKKQSE